MSLGAGNKGLQKEMELHKRHKELLDNEMDKLIQLNELVSSHTMQTLCREFNKDVPKLKSLKLPPRYSQAGLKV